MQQNMMGHNIIITEPSSNLRALGRNALAGKWKVAVLAYIIYIVCTEFPPAVFNSFFGLNIGEMYNNMYGYGVGSMSADMYSQIYNSTPSYSLLSAVYLLIVSGPFTLGVTIFFLALFRKQNAGVIDIFLGFERFGKALGLMLFQGFFIVLWSLIGVAVMVLGIVISAFTITGGMVVIIIGCIVAAVFGTIATLKYSQAVYILADNPDKGIRECVDESKIMMKGNKAKLFWLQLSFIGWILLASIPTGILSGVAEAMQMTGIALIIINVIAALFMAPVGAYTYSSVTGFYEILAGHLIKETEPAPINTDGFAANEQLVQTSEPSDHIPEIMEDNSDHIPEIVEDNNEKES